MITWTERIQQTTPLFEEGVEHLPKEMLVDKILKRAGVRELVKDVTDRDQYIRELQFVIQDAFLAFEEIDRPDIVENLQSRWYDQLPTELRKP